MAGLDPDFVGPQLGQFPTQPVTPAQQPVFGRRGLPQAPAAPEVPPPNFMRGAAPSMAERISAVGGGGAGVAPPPVGAVAGAADAAQGPGGLFSRVMGGVKPVLKGVAGVAGALGTVSDWNSQVKDPNSLGNLIANRTKANQDALIQQGRYGDALKNNLIGVGAQALNMSPAGMTARGIESAMAPPPPPVGFSGPAPGKAVPADVAQFDYSNMKPGEKRNVSVDVTSSPQALERSAALQAGHPNRVVTEQETAGNPATAHLAAAPVRAAINAYHKATGTLDNTTIHPSTHTLEDFIAANRHITMAQAQAMASLIPKQHTSQDLIRGQLHNVISAGYQNRLKAALQITDPQKQAEAKQEADDWYIRNSSPVAIGAGALPYSDIATGGGQ